MVGGGGVCVEGYILKPINTNNLFFINLRFFGSNVNPWVMERVKSGKRGLRPICHPSLNLQLNITLESIV